MKIDQEHLLASALLHLFYNEEIRLELGELEEVANAYNIDNFYNSFEKELIATFPKCYKQIIKPFKIYEEEDQSWGVSSPEQIAIYYSWKANNGLSQEMLLEAKKWLKLKGNDAGLKSSCSVYKHQKYKVSATLHTEESEQWVELT